MKNIFIDRTNPYHNYLYKSLIRMFYDNHLLCQYNHSYQIEEAPEPEDIIFENLEFTSKTKAPLIKKKIQVYVSIKLFYKFFNGRVKPHIK